MIKDDIDRIVCSLDDMKHSPLRNYVIPGLTSWIVGGDPHPARGCVRLFENARRHQESIVPHSHRFDFTAFVLRGSVTNRVWREIDEPDCDLYVAKVLHYNDAPGKYTQDSEVRSATRWDFKDARYTEGHVYSMVHDEVHSIYFSRDARVLFFEGPTISNTSVALEPFVDGEVIPVLKTEPWMFKRQKEVENGF